MKKPMTKEDAIKKIVKVLVKEFREKNKSGNNSFIIDIGNRLNNEMSYSNTENKYVVTESYFGQEGDAATIFFTPMSKYAMYDFSNEIYRTFFASVKMPKSVVAIPDTETHHKFGTYMSTEYTEIKSVRFVVPCKEFIKVNKKLAAINVNPIPVKEWWYGETFGKRSTYDIVSTMYFATDKIRCEKMLAYLKGKKKISWKSVRIEHLEDMEYGERYETEWSGAIELGIEFTDAKGRKATFSRYTY